MLHTGFIKRNKTAKIRTITIIKYNLTKVSHNAKVMKHFLTLQVDFTKLHLFIM